MLKNYFKIAWRNLVRNKVSSIINIGGLAIGMAVAIQIGLWIHDELSFNKNFDHYSRIARVMQYATNNGEVQAWNNVPYPLAGELRINYGADFNKVALCAQWGDHILAYDEKRITKNGLYAEQAMPDLLSLKMLQGNRASLTDPATVFLSASAASAFFGKNDPINKVIKVDNKINLKVTGVYQDIPHNSSFANLDFISTWDIYFANTEWIRTTDNPWRPNAFQLFVQLNDNADFVTASARIKDSKIKRVNAQLAKKKPEIFLSPMSDWHLYAEYKDHKNVGGAIQYVWLFGVIGVFVLLLACINFMNLSTARSEKRAKEVGIRKTLGSERKQLVLQFFSESLLTALLAFVLSIVLVQLTISYFNTISGKTMSVPWTNIYFWLAAIGFSVFTGLIAGSYPSFYLSSFNPVKVLKGTFKAGRFAALPRKVLVVIQFTVSVTLITGTIIVYRQIQFAKERPVGYSRNGLVTVPMITDDIHDHIKAVKQDLLESGTVASVTESGSPTTGVWNSTSGISWPGKDPNLSTDFGNVTTSFDFGKTIGWKIKEGRDFSPEFQTDSAAIILNETAAKYMGLKNPVGETITWFDNPFHVIGVVENIVAESPYEEVKPIVYVLSRDAGNVAIIRINPNANVHTAVEKIGAVFKKYNPQQPFDYKFTDEEYAWKFGNEERIGKLAGVFAVLAVLISCLGLFGLTAFVAEQRKKEIGVRKILGATVLNVWNLLSKDFVILVLVSFLIAVPLSYYFMYKWLLNYHYRAELSWWIFALAAAGALMITLLTVSFQAIKAGLANPVKSLRTE